VLFAGHEEGMKDVLFCAGLMAASKEVVFATDGRGRMIFPTKLLSISTWPSLSRMNAISRISNIGNALISTK
jgi:hypothetical protein